MKFDQVTKECVDMVKSAGFEVPEIEWKIKKYKSMYGQTEKRMGKYTIKINEYLLETENEKEIKDTVIHEILHTLPKCMNHGKEWKNKAMIINNKYGMSISRTGDFKIAKMQENREQIKYIFKCKECGGLVKMKRMSKFVKHPENYKCGKCGGKFERIL